MRRFADVMAANKGHTTGFDYLRIFLASAVVFTHAFRLQGTGHYDLYHSRVEPFWNTILPGFFALSGILVASSLIRNSIPEFVSLRVLRLFPALVVEVLLSCLVLGPIFTTLPLGEYFSSPVTHQYLLNMFGDIHFPLPGVFAGEQVNAQLWTVPIELDCYLAIIIIGLLNLVRHRWVLLTLVVAAEVLLTIVSIFHPLVQAQHPPTGRLLIFSFLSGTLIHYFRDRIPYHPGVFVGAIVATLVTLSFPVTNYLSPFPLAYVIGYIGLMSLPKIKFGDLSYGLYLFHYPLMLTINSLTNNRLEWWGLFPLGMVAGCIFAAMSWNLIEKPLLERKKQILALVDRALPKRINQLSFFNPKEAPDVDGENGLPAVPTITPNSGALEPSRG